VDQGLLMDAIATFTDRSRTVDGTPTSLADLGFTDIGIDDAWQLCGSYGPNGYTYHDEHGAPVVDTSRFPSFATVNAVAHAANLTTGFYSNNCKCKDHCSDVACFAGDVDATLAMGFDSIKLGSSALTRSQGRAPPGLTIELRPHPPSRRRLRQGGERGAVVQYV